ncbi:hypothetical protein GR925_27355 [Streptomyces sp. HUCO-GS316]|uniref:hypothetical protein n=1 Tax=Streptomyces sp. HUCO-GS316 TaxID=2692198 RepID=UPI001371D45D|nr:hypothetical protein [Streptomyces sp. HUCO-GS316]MXM67046.1 hypothetical protein [Streptomyces sp. HUCO-GS316]
MRQVLKAKSAYSNDDVQRVYDSIGDYVTEEEADAAVTAAAAETLTVLNNRPDDAVYGWSGGKDSIALQVVMERAGVRRALLGTIPHVEFRAYLDWCDAHQPDGLTVIENRTVTPAWLALPQNDRYLFPTNSTDGYRWTMLGTRRAQHLYQEEHGPRLQIYGRRTADGNSIPPTDHGIHRTRRLTSYCPMRTWSHELVLAVIHYNRRCLPPVYSWPNGWRTGTGSWPGRRVGTRDASFAETYSIEPDRLHEAAPDLPAAADWLRRHEETAL